MLKKLLACMCLCACLLTSNIPVVYAAETEVDVINNISTGDINIQLDEYSLDMNGNEIPMPSKQMTTPGKTVPEIVRVTNLGNDAWIRIKPDFIFDEGMEGVDESMFVFANGLWVKRGDYYYCTEGQLTGESVDFLSNLKIPPYWDESYSQKEFSLHFTAEAVQMANFTPDFESEDPWFGTLIEICVHDHYDEPRDERNDLFGVSFEGGAEGLIRLGDDFFHNWSSLMPGDRASGEVTIKNNYKEKVSIYFRTETIADDDLLHQLKLKISNQDTVIFDGPMDEVLKEVLLKEYEPGDETKLIYEVYMPAELGNKYAVNQTKTRWIWRASLMSKPVEQPETGDSNAIYYAAAGFGLALVTLIVLLIITNKKKGGDSE